VLCESGDLEGAEHHLQQVLTLDGRNALALSNLGNLYQRQGRLTDAVTMHRLAVSSSPARPAAWNNLRSPLRSLGQLDEALEALQRAVSLDPRSLEGVLNLGQTLMGLGHVEAAAEALTALCQLHPSSAQAHYYRGQALEMLGDCAAAKAEYETSLRLDPNYAHKLASHGMSLHRRGDLDGALSHLEKAIRLRPDLPDNHSCYLFVLSSDSRKTSAETYQAHCAWGRRHRAVPWTVDHSHHDRDPDRRLRIGYVSPDFHQIAVMGYLEPVLQHHDRDRVYVCCYSQVFRENNVTQRVKSYADQWRCICGLSDQQLARQIAADEIDILIDLAVHTAHNRLPAFAYKPAPVQMTWLGYPNTTGLSAVDYFLTNSVQDPPHEHYHVEQPIYLPVDTCFAPLDGAWPVQPPLQSNVATLPSAHYIVPKRFRHPPWTFGEQSCGRIPRPSSCCSTRELHLTSSSSCVVRC